MDIIVDTLNGFNLISVTFRMFLAAVFGGLIGIERGRHGRAAGLRTHILICIGAVLTSLVGLYATHNLGFGGDVTRISAQVISGIGFLGVGTILVKNHSIVTGLTTAAGLWTTAIIGIAVGFGFYLAAILATLICIISFTILNYFESKQKKLMYLYVELCDILYVNKFKEFIAKHNEQLVLNDIVRSKSGNENSIGLICVISNGDIALELETEINNIKEVSYTFRMID